MIASSLQCRYLVLRTAILAKVQCIDGGEFTLGLAGRHTARSMAKEIL